MSLKLHFVSLQLVGPDIHPQHCVVAHSDNIVTITPARLDAETFVNNRRIGETTLLQHGAVVRFGRLQHFRFIDPMHGEVTSSSRQTQVHHSTLHRTILVL